MRGGRRYHEPSGQLQVHHENMLLWRKAAVHHHVFVGAQCLDSMAATLSGTARLTGDPITVLSVCGCCTCLLCWRTQQGCTTAAEVHSMAREKTPVSIYNSEFEQLSISPGCLLPSLYLLNSGRFTNRSLSLSAPDASLDLQVRSNINSMILMTEILHSAFPALLLLTITLDMQASTNIVQGLRCEVT